MAPRFQTCPDDWKEWNHHFRCRAVGAGLWQKIDPDATPKEPFLTAPERPSVGNYATVEDEQPDVSGIIPAKTAGELTEAGRSCFLLDWTVYDKLDRDYKDELKQIQTLKDWMLETVCTRLITMYCEPTGGIDDWYAALKKHVDSFLEAREQARIRSMTHNNTPRSKWGRWPEDHGLQISRSSNGPTYRHSLFNFQEI